MSLAKMIPPQYYEVDPVTGCWNYTGKLGKNGRPALQLFGSAIFRALCWAKNGPPPFPDFHAAHTCNNRVCINDEHAEWQAPEVNNPGNYGDSELTEYRGVNIKLKRRTSAKGGGRYVTGWCAIVRLGGKGMKSGAYTVKTSAIRWAEGKIDEQLGDT